MATELLLVDDEPKLCKTLKAFFEDRGFHVVTAHTAEEALAQLRRAPVDVVLLDLKLPDGSGLDILPCLKHEYPDVRVVMISALADSELIQEAFQRGASHYLTKPFEFRRCFYAAMGCETVDVTAVQPEPEALSKVPPLIAYRYRVLPIRLKDGRLQAAVADPLDAVGLRRLEDLLQCKLTPLAAVGGELSDAIDRWYRTCERSPKDSESESAPRAAVSQDGEVVARLAEELFDEALQHGASDLYLGVDMQGSWLRARADGAMISLPVRREIRCSRPAIIAHLKRCAGIAQDPAPMPQEGRYSLVRGSTRFTLRICVLPTFHGEQVAIHVSETPLACHLEQLGLTEEQLARLRTLVGQPGGLIIATGPVGSGRSTTLWALLAEAQRARANAVAIEEHLTHELPGVTQVRLQPDKGLTLERAVLSALDHDPEVILIDEIRTREVAALALRAALDGRLVLSAMATADAASGLVRLLDLAVEPFLVCAATKAVIGQRTIRLLCDSCRIPKSVAASSLLPLGLPGTVETGTIQVWNGKGCQRCRGTGYHGRSGLFELLTIDHHLRSLLLKRAPTAQLRQSAQARGMATLWQAGWQRAEAGVTSLEELARVLPLDLHS